MELADPGATLPFAVIGTDGPSVYVPEAPTTSQAGMQSKTSSTASGDNIVAALRRELSAAHRRAAATAEVLKLINHSRDRLQPVLDAIVTMARQLCQADYALIFRFLGGAYRLAAASQAEAAHLTYASDHPIAPGRGSCVARTGLEKRTIHIHDVLSDPEYETFEYQQSGKYRTVIGVPLLCEGDVIGVIFLARTLVQDFTEREIELVTTFANQAVIAIENTRLFEAEQSSNRELQVSLEYQSATAEVLNVISRSPTAAQPVFDAIVESAARLCNAAISVVWLYDGELIHYAASHNFTPEVVEHIRKAYPKKPDRSVAAGRAILDCSINHIPDMLADPAYAHDLAMAGNWRASVAVPMLRDDKPIGAISIGKSEAVPFTERQVQLLTTFADQAVIAIENTRLFEEVQARNRALADANKQLTETLEQQTATSKILRVISRSSTDAQPVFGSTAESSARLCDAERALIYRFDGEFLRLVASYNASPQLVEFIKCNPISPGRQSNSARAALERQTVHIPDAQADAEYTYGVRHVDPIRSTVAVPMLKGNVLLGVIVIYRLEVRPFTDKQISLVETFADQAAIAISNVGLFEEVQARNAELRVTLEQQTATSELLKVIGRSTFNLQPVFETLAENAVKLCEAEHAFIFRFDGQLLRSVATYNIPPALKSFVDANPIPPGRGSGAGRAALERRTVQIEDMRTDPEFTYGATQVGPMRTLLAVPMLRADEVLGVILITRPEVQLFCDNHIALMETFADQAVIAIENTRLFEALQVRNRELRAALEQQTATSEVLSVISRSKFDLQPVFETIARGAALLCGGIMGGVFRYDGELMHVGAMVNFAAGGEESWRGFFPRAATPDIATGRAILEKTVAVVTDVKAHSRAEWAREVSRAGGYQSAMAVPMLREGVVLGAILVARAEPGPFPEVQIELLKTFADQAVIAIENTRLFEEVQARNRDLTALGEVGRAVSSTLDLNLVLKTIVERAVELSDTDAGSIFYYRPQTRRFELGETVGLDRETVARYRKLAIAAGQTGLGEAIAKREPLPIPDVTKRASNALRDAAFEAGMHAALIVPLLGSESALGALVLQRRQTGEFPPTVVSLMQSFADQSAIALENARLFDEIAQKSRELEIASQHKSQFVANMSHELRTPLAAILGYAELIQEGFYGPLPDKALDSLTRIHSNGKHLLGLINTVLDVAKIESGQFTLNMAEYAIESIVETVRSATESLAQNKKIALKTEVAKSLPIGLGDEQRLTQVLLNLVGNAIKFTDTGEVRVTAKAMNGHFTVSVTDTGPGIPEAHQMRIFDQFHQVDSSNTKAKGGTGLGLAIAKQIIEMHGGRIWVESTFGKGSTFRMELPTRAEFSKRTP
jgi:GAF domain-containing protein